MSTTAILILPDPNATNGHRVETIDLDQHGDDHHEALRHHLKARTIHTPRLAPGIFLWTNGRHSQADRNQASELLAISKATWTTGFAHSPAVITAITYPGPAIGLTPGQAKRWSTRARKAAAAAAANEPEHEKGRNQ